MYVVVVPAIHTTEFRVLAATKRAAMDLVRQQDPRVEVGESRFVKRLPGRWAVERDGSTGAGLDEG